VRRLGRRAEAEGEGMTNDKCQMTREARKWPADGGGKGRGQKSDDRDQTSELYPGGISDNSPGFQGVLPKGVGGIQHRVQLGRRAAESKFD
jgi:hypothetical protein